MLRGIADKILSNHPGRQGAVFAVVYLAAAGLIACEPDDAPDKDPMQGERELLQDEAKATTEYQRRLREQVQHHAGVLVIRETDLPDRVSVVPASTMWIIDCGPTGLDVNFGAPSGENGGGPSITLTGASIPPEAC